MQLTKLIDQTYYSAVKSIASVLILKAQLTLVSLFFLTLPTAHMDKARSLSHSNQPILIILLIPFLFFVLVSFGPRRLRGVRHSVSHRRVAGKSELSRLPLGDRSHSPTHPTRPSPSPPRSCLPPLFHLARRPPHRSQWVRMMSRTQPSQLSSSQTTTHTRRSDTRHTQHNRDESPHTPRFEHHRIVRCVFLPPHSSVVRCLLVPPSVCRIDAHPTIVVRLCRPSLHAATVRTHAYTFSFVTAC